MQHKTFLVCWKQYTLGRTLEEPSFSVTEMGFKRNWVPRMEGLGLTQCKSPSVDTSAGVHRIGRSWVSSIFISSWGWTSCCSQTSREQSSASRHAELWFQSHIFTSWDGIWCWGGAEWCLLPLKTHLSLHAPTWSFKFFPKRHQVQWCASSWCPEGDVNDQNSKFKSL